MNSEIKISLDEIEVGDEVAFRQGSTYRTPLKLIKVTKVTKTQIVCDLYRFRKDDGSEVSQTNYKAFIYPLGKIEKSSEQTYLQLVGLELAQYQDEALRYKYARFIVEHNSRTLANKFDSATLEQAAKLLGYAE